MYERDKVTLRKDKEMKYILLIMVALICGCSQPNCKQVKVVSKWTQEDYDKARSNLGNVKFPHAILEDESGFRYWTSLPTAGNIGDTFMVDVNRLIRIEDCN